VDEGVASYHMLEAGCKVVGIDVRDDKLDKGLRDKDGFVFLNKSSLDCQEDLQSLVNEYGPIGLVYQDSSHHYLESKKEWELISPLCKEGAIWICDDITPDFYDEKIDPPIRGCANILKRYRDHIKSYIKTFCIMVIVKEL